MKKPQRTPLSAGQIEDAERLRAIYKMRVKESKQRGEDPPLNQTEVGERCEWKSAQSAFSQYMNAKVALNLDAVIRLSKALSCEPADISPSLAEGIRLSSSEDVKVDTSKEAANTPLMAGSEIQSADESMYDLIVQYSAKAAAGRGEENAHVEVRGTLAFKKSWIKRKGLKVDSLAVIFASGHSMDPTIHDWDALLIDVSTKTLKNGKVFAFSDRENETIVKRAVKEGGEWLLRSDNADKSIKAHQDMPFTDEEGQRFEVIGQVIWRGGDL